MGFKNNNFIELKGGDRITLRNGNVLSYDEYYDKITNLEDSRINYKQDLTHKSRRELDIVEVKRPVEYEIVFSEDDREEVEENDVDILEKIQNELQNVELKKGSVIVIKL